MRYVLVLQTVTADSQLYELINKVIYTPQDSETPWPSGKRDNVFLYIKQGGHNAGALMLLAGVPLFICPGQLEQAVWAHRVCAQGLGVTVNFFNPTPDFRTRLEAILSTGAAVERAKAFATKYAAFDPLKQVEEIVNQCLTLSRT